MTTTSRRSGRAAGAVLLTAALLALAACGYGSKRVAGTAPAAAVGGGSGPALSASTVRIGYLANITHATPLVGIRTGLFQRDLGGTRVRTQVFGAGPAEVEALNAGAVDIGWIGPSPAVNGYVKSGGTALRIIAGSVSGGAELVVDPSRIRTVADLRGKRIASPQLGNTQDVALLDFLKSRGFSENPETGAGDVSVVRTGSALIPQAYQAGQIDGAWVPEPTAAELTAAGGRVLVNEAALWPGGKFATTDVVVSQSFLTAHPDVVEAVLKASVDTNAWIRAHPDRARSTADAALAQLTGKALPAGVLDRAWADITVTDDPLAATLAQEARHAEAAGFLGKPDLSAILDLTPLNRILAAAGRPTVSAAGLGTQ